MDYDQVISRVEKRLGDWAEAQREELYLEHGLTDAEHLFLTAARPHLESAAQDTSVDEGAGEESLLEDVIFIYLTALRTLELSRHMLGLNEAVGVGALKALMQAYDEEVGTGAILLGVLTNIQGASG
jgi:hypothetical protein